jgi:hypothetical protein
MRNSKLHCTIYYVREIRVREYFLLWRLLARKEIFGAKVEKASAHFFVFELPVTLTPLVLCVDHTSLKMSHHHHKDMCVAYLLWFFLGVFGVHRFYLGMLCAW